MAIIRTREDEDKYLFNTPIFGFLDILGFKQLVKNNDHKTLVSLYRKLISNQVRAYKSIASNLIKESSLQVVNISDSIIIWTKNSRESSFIELLFAVNSFMQVSIQIGIPLRGAVLMGDIEVIEEEKNLSIFGRALVDAYELESKQMWSGCYVYNNIFKFLQSIQENIVNRKDKIITEKLKSLIVETEIPMKKENKEFTSVSGYVINWASGLTLTEEKIKESFSKYNKRKNEKGDVAKDTNIKIENTIKFYNSFKNIS